ncbi:MAG: 1-acyl-sn-glycerol-3-phosphate acyltransferase, partial [Paracoccaceae bacterium]
GWWGEMGFGPSLLRIMATAPQGRVEVVYHPPVRVDAFADRKALARHLEGQVRAGLLDRDVLE